MSKLVFLILSGLLVCTPLYAKQVQLLSISQVDEDINRLNLDFQLSEKPKFKAFILNNPSRLVVDFVNTDLVDGEIIPIGKSLYFDRVRTGRRNKQDLRLVFDLNIKVKSIELLVINDLTNKNGFSLNLTANSVIENKQKIISDIPKDDIRIQKVDTPQSEEQRVFSGWDFSGKLGFEELGFFHQGLDSRQHNNYISGSVEPEIYHEWDNGKQSFTFSPFFRYSQHDNKRTHFDIRELTWLLSERDWELRVGFRKVFWGVAEGLHLVDIINQTDLVENTDTEDKLGQPMVNLALIREWGTLDLFVLPGFRERTFPGQEGRLRSLPEVSVGEAEFEHHGLSKHMAFAMRWAQVIGDWDVGLSHFYGTSREPTFKPKISPAGSLLLIPYYELINQTGLDLQLTHEDWILKHEGILRSGQGNAFYAMTTGVEYTLFDLFSSGLDLGLVVEYMYDTRSSKNILAPFQDDILTALRFGFNDVQSTEILAGVMFDRTNNSKFYNIEASRRIGDSFKIDLEMRLFSGAPNTDTSYSFRDDDHIRMEIAYYF